MPSGELQWIDLVDPSEQELADAWLSPLYDVAHDVLLAPAATGMLVRPRLESHFDYVLGVLLVPLLIEHGTDIRYQEVDLVLTHDAILSVRKTPKGSDGTDSDAEEPFAVDELRRALHHDPDAGPGTVLYLIADDIAESYLTLVDNLHDAIDDLEDQVEDGDPRDIHRQISQLRHTLLDVRRTLAPMRDAVHRVVDGRVDLDDGTMFPRALELRFGDVYDKFLRAGDGMESARDLIGGVRDYVQAQVANGQNEVMKRLTVSASLLLLPTFIVGVYGQNFVSMPELHWHYGYSLSWTVIIVTTILQLWYFRKRKWI